MLKRECARILARYGQQVRVYTKNDPEGVILHAFVQPMREKGTEQSVPSPLGQVMQDRFVYLGPADRALDENSRVELDGEHFLVQAAHPIRMGRCTTHWWAVLTRRVREVAE